MTGGVLHFYIFQGCMLKKSIYNGCWYLHSEADKLLKDQYKLDSLLLAQKGIKVLVMGHRQIWKKNPINAQLCLYLSVWLSTYLQ